VDEPRSELTHVYSFNQEATKATRPPFTPWGLVQTCRSPQHLV